MQHALTGKGCVKRISDAGLVPDQGKGLPDAWEVFDADAAKPILEELIALVQAHAFASLIGASRSQFDILVDDRVLDPLLTGTNVKTV
ncbi:hypothetical protein [Leisingera methylohalidivorans]|uniref:hypothetical protein n=1 Tax=Leisingera methylohalidivorans TaxID=133924 RepID=UPI0005C60681|nr:hypothetical protein [Leisingera methylohalidivorans]